MPSCVSFVRFCLILAQLTNTISCLSLEKVFLPSFVCALFSDPWTSPIHSFQLCQTRHLPCEQDGGKIYSIRAEFNRQKSFSLLYSDREKSSTSRTAATSRKKRGWSWCVDFLVISSLRTSLSVGWLLHCVRCCCCCLGKRSESFRFFFFSSEKWE